MPTLTPSERLQLLDGAHGPHEDHAALKDYCRSCDAFYYWCCDRAPHVGHRVYRQADGTLDLTPFALDTRGQP